MWRIPLAVFAFVATGVAVLGAWRQITASHVVPSVPVRDGHGVGLARDQPLAIRPSARKLLPVSNAKLREVLSRLQPLDCKEMTASLCLHLLRVQETEATVDLHGSRRIPLLSVFTDSAAGEAYFGHPTLQRTRHGVRYPTALRLPVNSDPARESHRDQCLAALGELGLPLSTLLRVKNEDFALREVLRDSIAEFHLQQGELTWTAVAYAHYLPPEREWVNRFGEGSTFDDLVEALLARSLDSASCAGTHLVHALAVVARADAELPVLDDSVRERLWDRLRAFAAAAASAQLADGSWRLDWHRGVGPGGGDVDYKVNPADTSARLVATGHLTEFLLYFPEELQPSDESLRRAASWLRATVSAASHEDVRSDFCPYTHAVCALRQLMFVESKPSGLADHGDR